MKLILEPLFEADFQDGSFGHRPGRNAHDAVERVVEVIVRNKTRALDLDLQGYFDNIRHDVLLLKMARWISDPEVLRVLKLILKATGKRGIAQGDVLAPMLSNVYLIEVDRMLERAKVATRNGKYAYVEYARFADDRLRQAGAIRVFVDVISGQQFERPGLSELTDHARAGDSLSVIRLDRLGRSLKELLETVENLKAHGIHLVSLEERIDTTSAAGELVFHVFGAIAHFERRLISERTRDGIQETISATR